MSHYGLEGTVARQQEATNGLGREGAWDKPPHLKRQESLAWIPTAFQS